MNKKKLLLIILLIVSLASLFLLFLRRDPKPPQSLIASEVVATNIKFSGELPQDDGSLLFFSGTTLADIALPKKAGSLVSQSRFTDIPFVGVDKVSTNGNLTILRAHYDARKSLLKLNNSGNSSSGLSTGKRWFIIDKAGNYAPVMNLDQNKIVDGITDEENIYLLVEQGQSKQQLVSMKGSGPPNTLAGGLSATSFVGASEGRLVLRDYAGKVYVHQTDTTEEVASNVGDVYFDKLSNNLVYSSIAEGSVSEEGGVGTTPSAGGGPTKVTAISLVSRDKRTLTLPYPIFFVSRGYVLSVPDISKPLKISFTSLTTADQFDITVDQSFNKVISPIRSLHIIQDDLGLIGGVTTNNQLVVFGKADYVKRLSPIKLPLVKTTIGLYGYTYNVRANQLVVYYDRGALQIDDSLKLFENQCDCDINQLSKLWEETASGPGH